MCLALMSFLACPWYGTLGTRYVPILYQQCMSTCGTISYTVPIFYEHTSTRMFGTNTISVVTPDPTFFDPGSRIRTVSIPDPGSASKNFSILTQKNKNGL